MINGDELREQVRATVADLIAGGREAGVQVCAYLDGEVLVDEAFGVAHDTPIFSFSTGKGLTATVVHVLAERGEIDYDLRIADVWPEYAAHGKGDTTLRHALTHSAGVPALPADITRADLTDWSKMCALLAALTPLWTPGSRYGYHAWTFGYLVGETVRRVTGRTLKRTCPGSPSSRTATCRRRWPRRASSWSTSTGSRRPVCGPTLTSATTPPCCAPRSRPSGR